MQSPFLRVCRYSYPRGGSPQHRPLFGTRVDLISASNRRAGNPPPVERCQIFWNQQVGFESTRQLGTRRRRAQKTPLVSRSKRGFILDERSSLGAPMFSSICRCRRSSQVEDGSARLRLRPRSKGTPAVPRGWVSRTRPFRSDAFRPTRSPQPFDRGRRDKEVEQSDMPYLQTALHEAQRPRR
jgi:hypothetical protein